jgi:uncharacterized protein YbjT (DUF2867 family)
MEGTVLVAGASGYVGGQLVPNLLARGIHVRALSRSPDRLAHFARQGVEVVQGDVIDRSSLRSALRGVRAAYYLVHSMSGEGGRSFAEYDRYGAQNFASESKDLDQVIYLGGLGDPEDDLSPHLRSRYEVGQILMEGIAPTTVLRAGMVIGRESTSFVMLRSLVQRLPLMVCPRWVDTRTQPSAVADVLAYLDSALGTSDAFNAELEIGGSEVMTYKEMMDRMGAILGRRHLILKVPVLTPTLSAYWVDLVTPVSASVAHALIEGLRNEVVVRDDSARRVLPIPLTSFDTAVRSALVGGP